jgi:hypothetical protein
MMLLKPFDDLVAQAHRKRSHGGRISVRHRSNPLVSRDVPLLPESIEGCDSGGVDADSLPQRLYDPEVVRIPRCAVACRCERCGGCLERSVVGDVQAPVSAESFRRAVGEIAFDDLQEIADFVWAGLVLC